MRKSRTMWRVLCRAVLVLASVAGLAFLGTGVAAAHVTAEPDIATKGDYAKVSFRVPNESSTAGTVKLEITLPADHPITSVRTSPVPGWTAEITKAPVNPPVERNGATITEAPRTITWTAQPGNRIGPNEFVEFDVSMGPLPEDVDQLHFPATQTYDDGRVVSWNEPTVDGGPEPEHPAPSVRLVAGENGHHGTAALASATSSSGSAGANGSADETARWLGGAGLVLGVIGLALGVGALLRARGTGKVER